jgi:hypothetical protein
MLIIRQEQLQIFERVALESWVLELLGYVEKNYPRQFEALGRDGFHAFILRAIASGRSNYVDTRGGVAVLLELMIQFGENFEHSPDRIWAREMLAHPTLPAQVKLTLMYRRMTEQSKGRVIVPFVPERDINS